MQSPNKVTETIIDMRQVLSRVPASKSAIYLWVQKGRFPKPHRFGPRRSGWLESEVNAWINQQMAA